MYDKALEQLIDAVIADGIITDQERKVVYKKAASLGIDQDEIEVYLNGRLDQFLKENDSQSKKHGVLRECPSCGASVEAGIPRCRECGYVFVGVKANSSAEQFAKGLSKLLTKHKDASESKEEEARDREIREYIKNFPLPTSKEDLIEFISSMDARRRSQSAYQSAYGVKYKECVTKANVLFAGDSHMDNILHTTSKFSFSLLTKSQKIIGVCVICLLIILAFVPTCVSNRQAETKRNNELMIRQRDSLFVLLDELEVPTVSNYKEMEHALLKIVWTDIEGDYDSNLKESYLSKKRAYAEQIYSIYKDIYGPVDASLNAPKFIEWSRSIEN